MRRLSVEAVTCPGCGLNNSRVIHSFQLPDGRRVRRRRCEGCSEPIFTVQPPEALVDRWKIKWEHDGRATGLLGADEINEKT